MITLVVDNLEKVTILEYLLYSHEIDYTTVLDDGRYGIVAPYLLVYGAPLDEQRAIRWIISRMEDCYCE